MPSMTATFDKAFNPNALSDDRIDRLATLMGSVSNLDRMGRWCTMTDGDETGMVFDNYCSFCNMIHDPTLSDGTESCIHKRALELSWQAEMEARDRDRDEDTERRIAAMVGAL